MKNNNNVPFHKVDVSRKEIDAVSAVLKSGWWTMGTKVLEFEQRFSKHLQVKYAVAVNSCTAALHLALLAVGIGPGDEVIIPVMTFSSTAQAVIYTGARPVFVDIEKDALNISVANIEKKISKKTRAIIIVDFAGQPTEFSAIKKIAKKNKLVIIEDAAHALPAYYKNKPIGGLADITCFSFYVTKTLAIGDGGMATTNNKIFADKMRHFRLHGMSRGAWKRYTNKASWKYQITDLGYKYNMTDIDAALGLVQWERNQELLRKRIKIAVKYSDSFTNIPEIIVPTIKNDRQTSWHLYVIKLETEKLKISRDQFIEKLSELGVSTSVHFIPLYRFSFYKKLLKYNFSQFPNSEWAFKRIISLPIFPSMTKEQVNYVIESVRNLAKKYRK